MMNKINKLICGEILYSSIIGFPSYNSYIEFLREKGIIYPCNKKELSRNNYSELFEILGTIYGEGDGYTTFNLPGWEGLDIVVKNYCEDEKNEEIKSKNYGLEDLFDFRQSVRKTLLEAHKIYEKFDFKQSEIKEINGLISLLQSKMEELIK